MDNIIAINQEYGEYIIYILEVKKESTRPAETGDKYLYFR